MRCVPLPSLFLDLPPLLLLRSLPKVCKRFAAIVRDDSAWRLFFSDRFPRGLAFALRDERLPPMPPTPCSYFEGDDDDAAQPGGHPLLGVPKLPDAGGMAATRNVDEGPGADDVALEGAPRDTTATTQDGTGIDAAGRPPPLSLGTAVGSSGEADGVTASGMMTGAVDVQSPWKRICIERARAHKRWHDPSTVLHRHLGAGHVAPIDAVVLAGAAKEMCFSGARDSDICVWDLSQVRLFLFIGFVDVAVVLLGLRLFLSGSFYPPPPPHTHTLTNTCVHTRNVFIASSAAPAVR